MKHFIAGLVLLTFSLTAMAEFSDTQICKAGIAFANGRSPQGMEIYTPDADLVYVGYVRNDGKVFVYACLVEGSQIRWRDKTMTKWNQQIKLSYSVFGDDLTITELFAGETRSKSFALDDF